MWFIVLNIALILSPAVNGSVAVLILARGGSKGVRLKNLQNVGNTSLISRAIYTARAAGFDDIIVSTDHPLIALQALRDNAAIFRRSRVSASDWAPSIWGVAEVLDFRRDITILILMQATSPFTRSVHLRNAIKFIDQPIAYDCIFSVTRSFKVRWKLVKGQLYPANFNVDSRVRRQDWNGELLETGAFYITRRRLLEEGKFQNNNCTIVEISAVESLEVDTADDLQLANILFSANIV